MMRGLDRDGNPAPPVGSKVRFTPSHSFGSTCEGVVTGVGQDSITFAEEIMVNGKLQFQTGVHCHFLRGIRNMVVIEPPKVVRSDDLKICEREGIDFSDFLLSGTYSDLQIKCQDQTFSCHRVVIAAVSPVFDAMLQNNMVEASSGTIEIRNMKPNVLKAVLECIYKNKIDAKNLKDDFNFARDLLAAAEMYDLTRLKQICEDELCDILAVNNVLMLLIVGDKHGASKLKEQALNLIAKRKKEVVNLEEWVEFVESYPKLTVQITRL